MYTLNEFDVLDLIDQAVEYGTNAWGKKEAMALQIANFWLDGWIEGHKEKLTDADIKSIKNTMKGYFFI